MRGAKVCSAIVYVFRVCVCVCMDLTLCEIYLLGDARFASGMCGTCAGILRCVASASVFS